MMAAIYKQKGRLPDRDWFARDEIRYIAPKSPRLPFVKVYSVVQPTPALTSIAPRFNALSDKWLRDTEHVSSVTQLVLHNAYQQIIGLGPSALPLIFARLVEAPHHWFWALSAITGENPVKPEDVGNVERMRIQWLGWARSHGYLRD